MMDNIHSKAENQELATPTATMSIARSPSLQRVLEDCMLDSDRVGVLLTDCRYIGHADFEAPDETLNNTTRTGAPIPALL